MADRAELVSPKMSHGVGPLAHHHLVALSNDVAHGFAKVRAYGIQIEIGVSQAQLAEKYFVERGVVVLAGMHHHMVEVAVGAAHHGGQADDLRPRAQHGHELELAGHFASSFGASTGRRMVSGRAGSKHSLAHIRVIMSVSPVFSIVVGVSRAGCPPPAARRPIPGRRSPSRRRLSEADDALTAEHHEFFMLGVMPVLALGDVRTGDVHADLSMAAQMQKLRKRSPARRHG